MTRVFLKLYLLLILPLLVLSLFPQSPLSLMSHWWFEKEAYRQYGAIYPLIKEDLDAIPQEQWIEKVEELSQHFAYALLLKKRSEVTLKQETIKTIDQKGFTLINYKNNSTLVFNVKDSPFLLYLSLHSSNSKIQEFEKDTRGFRYFLNKKIIDSDDPISEFERIKPYFTIKLDMLPLDQFKQKYKSNQHLIDKLLVQGLYLNNSIKNNMAFLLSEDKQYVIEIIRPNSRATFRRYYQYLSYIIPAILLAIGALIWLYLFRKEFKKLNQAAKSFGNGRLSTRVDLSKNSTLYPISDSFNEMATQIENLLKGHKDLTNAVSHELKTPLSRLHFALEMQKSSKTTTERNIYTQKIEDNIFALENLVDELLNYTRLQRKQSIVLVQHALKDWLDNEIENFKEYHPKTKMVNNNKIKKEVSFDAHLMSRALNNLLENAANHANPNSPIIIISTESKSDWISISVEDNGLGIDPKFHQKIFEPFARLDKSRNRNKKEKLGGYGMGLAIVKSIMTQHKGSIRCETSTLGGAKFTLIWRRTSL